MKCRFLQQQKIPICIEKYNFFCISDKYISGNKEEEEESNSELMQYTKLGFNSEHDLRQYYRTRHIGGKHDEAFNADSESPEPLSVAPPAKNRSSNRRPSPVRHLHNLPLKSEPLAAIRTRSPVPPIKPNDGVSPSPPSSATSGSRVSRR